MYMVRISGSCNFVNDHPHARYFRSSGYAGYDTQRWYYRNFVNHAAFILALDTCLQAAKGSASAPEAPPPPLNPPLQCTGGVGVFHENGP